MNKSLLVGMVAGVGLAAAGGVLGFQYFGQPNADVTVEPEGPAAPARAAPVPAPAARTAAAPAPAEECWDEEVTVTADPKDEHRIAGTAIGAVVGGAIGKDIGDRDITTAAGAAAGAVIGRKIQERIQENRAGQRTTTTIERRCGPPGSAPR
jgi:uncharacterized protein YcfJ